MMGNIIAVAAILVGILLFAMTTPPDMAASNFSKWLSYDFKSSIWHIEPSEDGWARYTSILLLLFGFLWLLQKLVRGIIGIVCQKMQNDALPKGRANMSAPEIAKSETHKPSDVQINNVKGANFSEPVTFGNNSPITQHIHNYGAKDPSTDTSLDLVIHAHICPYPYPAGIEIAGIVWRENYSDLRVYIQNNNDKSYSDFDAIVETDQGIIAAGLMPSSSGSNPPLNKGTCLPAHSMPSPTVLGINNITGNTQVIVPQGIATQQFFVDSHYRIHCEKIAANSGLEVVLAVVPRPSADTWPNLGHQRVIPSWVKIKATITYNGKTLERSYSIELSSISKGDKMEIGKNSVVYGNVPNNSKIGDNSVVVGSTDSNGNTIIGGAETIAIGAGAQAGEGSIAIGAGAKAGRNSVSIGCDVGCNVGVLYKDVGEADK